VEHATAAQSTDPKNRIKIYEQETCADSTVANTTDISYDRDPQVDDLLTFKQNNRNTETNREMPKHKQSHSQGQQTSNKLSAENYVDHSAETEARPETDEAWNNKRRTVTRSNSVVCGQCGNRYKDVSKHLTIKSLWHDWTCDVTILTLPVTLAMTWQMLEACILCLVLSNSLSSSISTSPPSASFFSSLISPHILILSPPPSSSASSFYSYLIFVSSSIFI
jgi:hypothetical protein